MAEAISVSPSMVNGYHNADGKSGLKVLIAGSGIAGLSAAIGLRQQGHEVHIYEQSHFATETGAALHIAPNAHGVLKKLGVDVAATGANLMQRLTEYTSTGELQRELDLKVPNELWQHEWLLAHRIHLHETLKKTAQSASFPGIPVELHLGSPIAQVDSSAATVTLSDGSVIRGDVVVGADGVHSRSRAGVVGGEKAKVFSSGKSAFRFLIERSAALEDPATREFVKKDGNLAIWYGTDRRVVMYPTSRDTLLNFICIHPEAESEASNDWNTQTNHETLLQVYRDFDPAVKALISKAKLDSLKVWKLLDMTILPAWTNDRLVLIGDAAHPFLPHQGQGAGCAIEDAAALSVVLERGLSSEDVPARLKLWESIRYERANRIQQYSRLAGKDLTSNEKLDMVQYTNYNFGHDEFDNATQRLREYKWALVPQTYWRMPIQFGPMPGPRQTHESVARNALESTFTTASIKFKTSRTVLQNLFPPGNKSFRFKSPGTVAYASFSQTTLNKMEWLGGSGYKHLGLYIHGVEYTKADGEIISGTYMPILFESLTDPIVSGREELGMPKLYSAIDVYRGAQSYRINTSWQGSQWGNFRLEGLQTNETTGNVTGKISGEDDDGILVYRYVPMVGRENKGIAAEEHPVFVPYKEDMPQPVPQRMWKATKAAFSIDALDWDCLPTLHHVIHRLQEIPIYEVVSGKVVEGVGVPDVGAAKRIE